MMSQIPHVSNLFSTCLHFVQWLPHLKLKQTEVFNATCIRIDTLQDKQHLPSFIRVKETWYGAYSRRPSPLSLSTTALMTRYDERYRSPNTTRPDALSPICIGAIRFCTKENDKRGQNINNFITCNMINDKRQIELKATSDSHGE